MLEMINSQYGECYATYAQVCFFLNELNLDIDAQDILKERVFVMQIKQVENVLLIKIIGKEAYFRKRILTKKICLNIYSFEKILIATEVSLNENIPKKKDIIRNFSEVVDLNLHQNRLSIRDRIQSIQNELYKEKNQKRKIKLKRKITMLENKSSFLYGSLVFNLYKNQNIKTWVKDNISLEKIRKGNI